MPGSRQRPGKVPAPIFTRLPGSSLAGVTWFGCDTAGGTPPPPADQDAEYQNSMHRAATARGYSIHTPLPALPAVGS